MAIKDLKKILEQVHEPNEFQLVSHDSSHPLYYIWKVQNVKMKDLNEDLRLYRKEHSRFDIFINGQYILKKDYISEQVNNDLHIKFIKVNFPYVIKGADDIKIEGDLELL